MSNPFISTLQASLDQISKLREDVSHGKYTNDLSHSFGSRATDIHERVSNVERSLTHIVSRLDRLEDSSKKPAAIEDVLASTEKILREAYIEMLKQQTIILQLQLENEQLKGSAGRTAPQPQQPHQHIQPLPIFSQTTTSTTTPSLPPQVQQKAVLHSAQSTKPPLVPSVPKPSAVPVKKQPVATKTAVSPPRRADGAADAEGAQHRLHVDFPAGYSNRGRRFSVAGESFNPTTDLTNVQRNIIKKSNDARTRIRTVITSNILFKNLDEEQLEDLIDEMFEVRLKPDEVIIRQGDDGDNFYVVDSGELYVLYKDVVVATIGVGKGFGEIALMYMCPRTATVKAKTDVILWGMSRATFRRSLMFHAIRKRELYESFLERVPLLESLLPYERSIIADALESKTFKDSDLIIKEGEAGDAFYIIEKGRVVVTKGYPPVEVKSCSEGDYFGELALLTDQPRAANVRAIGTVRVLYLRREDFAALMGPCEEILKRNTQIYNRINATLHNNSNQNGKTHDRVKPTSLPALVEEFVQDEQNYTKGLNAIVTEFLKPMRKAVDSKLLPISDEEVNQLFAHFEMLHTVHIQLATMCDHIIANPSSFGKTLRQAAPGFKFNAEVDQNWTTAIGVYDKYKDDERFQTFLKSSNRTQFDLLSLLSESHNRIPKILNYLKDFIAFAPNDKEAPVAMQKLESF